MNKLIRNWMFLLAVIVLATGFTSCEDDKTDSGDNEDLYRSILQNYVNTTVTPTYKSLAEAALEMRAANEALKQNPTDENMKAASDAWMKARIYWELSEAFLFGPVSEDALDVDGHIDSWPLEMVNIQKVLANNAVGLTGKKAWTMDPEEIGFHVTEYLLYREGKSRRAADVTTAELNYLTAATDALVWDCMLIYVAWVGEDNVTAKMKEVFNENPDVVAHLNENSSYKNYAQKFITAASHSGSWIGAVSEISGGAETIAGEVGELKINAPYEERKVENVESWYSWHSLDDYQNNILSIKNAYLGGVDNNSRTSVSLSTYVNMKNSTLDKQIKDKIEECRTKIKDIGKGSKSFYEVVRDQVNKTEVDAAVKACDELRILFAGIPEILE